jgi:Acetyl/propionyl-CoA carboxylase, alpha subunit
MQEDPSNDFLPTTGQIDVWEPAETPEVRYDSGIESGSEVSVEFDPMLAPPIKTRNFFSKKPLCFFALALERTRLHGTVTNRDFLVATLRHEEFLAGNTTTDFISRVDIPGQRIPSQCELEDAAIAIALVSQKNNREAATALAFMPSGFRNSSMPSQQLVLSHAASGLQLTIGRYEVGLFSLP